MGINYIFEVLCGGVGSLTPTLRLRCRSGVFHRRAAPPRSPLRARPSSWSSFPLLYVLWAVPLPGVGRQPSLRLALLQEVRLIRFVIPHMFTGRALGLPPRRYSFSSFRSHSISITLLRFLCLPGRFPRARCTLSSWPSGSSSGTFTSWRFGALGFC